MRVGFVTDIAQLGSTVDAEGWSGVQDAAQQDPCLRAELLSSTDPADYQRNLETLAERDSVVVAGSFLLTEAVVSAAKDRPTVKFILVDPLLLPAPRDNLGVITFREDQASFLAGALAAMISRSGVVGGVYGLADAAMTRYRRGFEAGARAIDPAIRVLGVYQGADDGPPFGNAAWGEQRARAWLREGADVIFGAGGLTGKGALLAAAGEKQFCVGAGADEYLYDLPARDCLLTSAVVDPKRAVTSEVRAATQGQWKPGVKVFGIAEAGVGLAPYHQLDRVVTPAMRGRLKALTQELVAGQFLDGN